MIRIFIAAAIAIQTTTAFAQTNAGGQVTNPAAAAALPNSRANAPNASPQPTTPTTIPPANAQQFQPNITASEATPNATGPGPSQRQFGPRQTMPRQYGTERLNNGRGVVPNFVPRQNIYNEPTNYGNAIERAMFPPTNRSGIGPDSSNRQRALYGYGLNSEGPLQPRNDLRMNTANVPLNGAIDPNVPSQPSAADVNGWRFANQNGTWWYWMPGDYWAVWNGGQWNRYTPAESPTNVTPSTATPAYSVPAVARPSFGPSTTTVPTR
jgi:hypothetical protein